MTTTAKKAITTNSKPPKKTKHLIKFLSRAAHFEADIELADVLAIASSTGALSRPGSQLLFDAINPEQHPRLAARRGNDHNRRLAVRHLKASLCASYIKDLYEDFNDYMQCILASAAKNGFNPERIVGSHKINLEASELLAAKDWDGVVRLVTKSIFRKMEEARDTKFLIKTMDSKLGLELNQENLEAALPYFELRHLLVHHDGVADNDFCKRFPLFGAQAGNKISVEFSVVQSARTAITKLAKEFDKKVVAGGFIATAECQ